ncbi:hypothetical protein AK812_SmicGene40707 [Symbiodinium microadriaticum]|uniref:Uncharacterized protein n=1 Tax=Symbiodinium microadriaticum TaxID=2951 RepID=A0A1Q9C7X1_SYMMI|nr:hypothetical protein AK812_SmicGene40707 [Symbiodinium microadriaticum]
MVGADAVWGVGAPDGRWSAHPGPDTDFVAVRLVVNSTTFVNRPAPAYSGGAPGWACAKERAKLEASCKEAEASVTQHQQEISLLQRRIAAADTRFAAEVACRKAAEERSAGAERRLAETEELLEKALAERIAAQRRLIELEGGRKPSDVDIEVKQDQ